MSNFPWVNVDITLMVRSVQNNDGDGTLQG